MANHVLKPSSHMTWYVYTSGDTWIVRKGLDFEVYNGDGISDTSAQHNNRFEISGHITAPDGEGLDLYGRNDTVFVAASGVIQTSHGFGIAFEGSAYNGKVENHGKIVSNFGGVSMTGASPQSGHQSTAEVVNYGRITGDSYGIDSRSDDLRIVNKHGGFIEGGQYGVGSDGNDVTIFNQGTIKGGAQGAVYLKNGGNDTLVNAGRIVGDVFFNGGNDTFISKHGHVTGIINAGVGADTYVVDSTALKLHEDDFSDIDTVKASISWTLGDNFEKLVLTGAHAINGRGNDDINTISGNGKANNLTGMGGDDTLRGGAGADHFVFATGSGHDTITDFKDHVDKIDLRYYAGIYDFNDIASIAGDHGNLVITLSNADTITLNGISAHEISGKDFLFA